MRTNDYDVIPYTDPEVALEGFEQGTYDLLLTNIMMRKMNGFELYKRIRAIDGKIKVCFMANDCEQQLELFLESFPYLPAGSLAEKPVVVDYVVKLVKEILK